MSFPDHAGVSLGAAGKFALKIAEKTFNSDLNATCGRISSQSAAGE
jgi:hypothetical protein